MRKIGILFFVSVLFFSCKKTKTVDDKFQNFEKKIETDLGIVFLEKNETQVFPAIELLEKDSVAKLNDFLNEILGEITLYSDKELSERNKCAKKIIQQYSIHKIIQEDVDTLGNLNIFSIVEVLNSEVEDESYSSEEQFSQIILRLEEIPLYFFRAKEIIKNPSKEKLQLAISQYSKDFFYLKDNLSTLIRKPDILRENQIDFSQKNKNAQLAVKDYLAFLNSHLFEQHLNTPALK